MKIKSANHSLVLKKQSFQHILLIGIVILIILGSFARIKDLAWHFTHFDDAMVTMSIREAKEAGAPDVLLIPKISTYAPFQFVLTHFLIYPGQDYREALFWGRFPSLLFSIGGLFAILIFYRLYSREEEAVLPALALLAFSWELIIYTKQANNYALGVTAAILLLSLFIWNLNQEKLTISTAFFNSAALALLASMHYQILFFLPAFFGSLLFYTLKTRTQKRSSLQRLLATALLTVLLLSPLYYFFLSHHQEAGVVYWNKGAGNEFFFMPPLAEGAFPCLFYTLSFFIKNFSLTFEAMTAFLPLNHPLSLAVSTFLLFLFGAGCLASARSRDTKVNFSGVFTLITALTWIFLIVTQKMTLSPTRHHLILLPLFVITCSQGFRFITTETFALRQSGRLIANILFSTIIACLFFSSFAKVLDERRDLMNETEILEVIKKFNPDTIYLVGPANLMTKVRKHISDPQKDRKRPLNQVRLFYISRTDPLTEKSVQDLVVSFIRSVITVERPLERIPYQILYSKNENTKAEVEFSPRTHNMPNTLYAAIIEFVIDPELQS